MKRLALSFCLASLPLAASAARLYVCTGTIGADTVTVVDDGSKLWAVKGTFEMSAGPGNLPKVRFEAASIQAQMSEGNVPPCTLSASSAANTLTLVENCTANDAAAKLSLNLAEIGLIGTDIPVSCETVEVRGGNSDRPRQ